MAKFSPDMIKQWEGMAKTFLTARGMVISDIVTGRDAWAVAHRSGITQEAYSDRNVTDGHIQTALEKVFPNAVFKDRKVY